tara:strand:+ start:613 stop:900 length:288 start_codon:yes stop_codon:yes gene_type:complete
MTTFDSIAILVLAFGLVAGLMWASCRYCFRQGRRQGFVEGRAAGLDDALALMKRELAAETALPEGRRCDWGVDHAAVDRLMDANVLFFRRKSVKP